MAQNGSVRTKNGNCGHHLPDGSEEFDIDAAIAHMREVGYRNSKGHLVLPDYYNDDVDYD